jgi:L-lactate dehydrogenase complex protein LldG
VEEADDKGQDMSTSRADIFANIRRSLGVRGSEATRLHVVAERMANTPIGILPARGQVDGAERLALFMRMAENAQAGVSAVALAADVPSEIARVLRDANLPATLRMGGDPRLAAMPWSDTSLEVSHGPSRGGDLNAVSHALGGVAETGTLVLTSGVDNPSTLNFLPDNHIVVVSAEDIARDYESAWATIRIRFGKGMLPRTVNWITGPSRSGDIEQKLLLGAHGPRKLHIVIINSAMPKADAKPRARR